MNPFPIEIRPEVTAALEAGQPVVALESTLIAHGLPWPSNLETARQAEAVVRSEGAIPATIAVWDGKPVIGLDDKELEALARREDVRKASRRDLAAAVAQRQTAATTVAASMFLAHLASIRILATGGIGGAHRDAELTGDVSADLGELARTPVAVVCAGAKSILDIPRTLEILETHGVPVVGYGTDNFPAFYLRFSGEKLSARVNTPAEAAAVLLAHWNLGGAGIVIAQPVAQDVALAPETWNAALVQSEAEANKQGIRGPALTPFLLSRVAEITHGQTLRANHDLVISNAKVAARIAKLV
jgi:pseudouridine-5'-phosphate glycosidase